VTCEREHVTCDLDVPLLAQGTLSIGDTT